MAIGALIAAVYIWRHYQVEPWTRDGRVRADIVEISPDVSGLVSRVLVRNDQVVEQGQPLFIIDRDRYALALRQAEALVAAQRASLEQARNEDQRNGRLGDLVGSEAAEQSAARVAIGAATLAQAIASRDLARLNLERTVVVAPAAGTLSDLTVRPGDYVLAGKPVLALIDGATLRVEGYFEETKLKGIHVGQPATVQIMGDGEALSGHVQSIAAGIEDRDRTSSPNLLPNVNPTFNWVRLAQRVPVRIALDRIPDDVKLIVGRTATVAVIADADHKTVRP